MPSNNPWPKIRSGWLCLVVFILLGASHLLAGYWFGRGWTVLAAVLAEIAWLILRPWRFGRLSPSARRTISVTGGLALGVFILIALLLYWRLDPL